MPKLKWPQNFDQRTLAGETILLPMCIDSEKHTSADLADLIELLNTTAAEGINFKVQFVRVDTIYRHNARYLLMCDAASKGQDITSITEQQVDAFTNAMVRNWAAKHLDVLNQINPALKTEEFIQGWDHWTKDKNEEKFKQCLAAAKAAITDNPAFREFLVRDNTHMFNILRKKIPLALNGTALGRRLGAHLKELIDNYLLEEDTVFRLWGESGFKFCFYAGELPSSMVHINTAYAKAPMAQLMTILKPRKVDSLELQATEAKDNVDRRAPDTHSMLAGALMQSNKSDPAVEKVTSVQATNTARQFNGHPLSYSHSYPPDRYLRDNSQPDPHLQAFFAVAIDKLTEAQERVDKQEAEPAHVDRVADACNRLLSRFTAPTTTPVVVPGIFHQVSPSRRPAVTASAEQKDAITTPSFAMKTPVPTVLPQSSEPSSPTSAHRL